MPGKKRTFSILSQSYVSNSIVKKKKKKEAKPETPHWLCTLSNCKREGTQPRSKKVSPSLQVQVRQRGQVKQQYNQCPLKGQDGQQSDKASSCGVSWPGFQISHMYLGALEERRRLPFQNSQLFSQIRTDFTVRLLREARAEQAWWTVPLILSREKVN